MKRPTCPLSAAGLLDSYFLENRARLLEIAAFLDRIDRAKSPDDAKADFRYKALRAGLKLVHESEGDRAVSLQLKLSDHSEEPLESAAELKGAYGAWPGAFNADY